MDSLRHFTYPSFLLFHLLFLMHSFSEDLLIKHTVCIFPCNYNKKTAKHFVYVHLASHKAIFTDISISLNPHRCMRLVPTPLRRVNKVRQYNFLSFVCGLNNTDDKHHGSHIFHVSRCIYQSFWFVLLLGYMTIPFNLEVFAENVDTFARTPGVRQI